MLLSWCQDVEEVTLREIFISALKQHFMRSLMSARDRIQVL